MQLQSRGIGLEDYLQITGRDTEAFMGELKDAADEAVRVDLGLRSVAVAQDLDVSEEELDTEIERLIDGADVSLDDAREQLQSGGQLSAVRSDLTKRKALEWLVDNSDVVDQQYDALSSLLRSVTALVSARLPAGRRDAGRAQRPDGRARLGLDLRYAASSLAWTTGIGVAGMSALALAL